MAKVTEPLDLRPPAEDPWARISVPPGWEPIARICRRVSDDADRLTEHIVRCFEDEIPAYRAPSAVPRADALGSVRRQIEEIFFSLAEHRGPTAEELRIRRELGHRRAAQGLPVDALLQAYHVGYRELWLELVSQASRDPDAQELLLTAATTFWGWMYVVTQAVAEAYEETSRAREALAAGIRQRFLELLVSGDLDSEVLAELARSLGFSAEGTYRAVGVRPHALDGSEVGRLQRELGRAGGVHQCLARGQELLVLSQEDSVTEVEAAVRRVVREAAVGIGVARPGLAGARQSIVDAERALALAVRRGGSVRFEEDWLPAMVLRSQEQLHKPLEVGLEVARRQPHLAETVRAFAHSGFSVSETARRLSLHPNSVTYRLDRWRQLTGWNPRSFSGLANSLAALELAD